MHTEKGEEGEGGGMRTWMLTERQKRAAATLFGLAMHQAEIYQSRWLPSPSSSEQHHHDSGGGGGDEGKLVISHHMSSEPASEDPQSWLDPDSVLLRPIFQFFEIESKEWSEIEQSAAAEPHKHHAGHFLRLLSEQSEECSSEKKDQARALAESVDHLAAGMEESSTLKARMDKHHQYEQESREKCSVPELPETPSNPSEGEAIEFVQEKSAGDDHGEDGSHGPDYTFVEESLEEERALSYERKIAVLYELLSASLATMSDESKRSKEQKGYDARHRVALRLLTTWFDVKWAKVEAMEVMIASSVMALAREEELKREESDSKRSSLEKWKRGGIIGAAAVTGGALMAITGGLAAPAIAAGFGALAPTMGAVIPVIGASGFAAAASVAGSVAGSVAIAASFGAAGAGLNGTKMARSTGSVDEFYFNAVGENHGQGRLAVEMLVSGFVFEEKDFIMPWEGLADNLETCCSWQLHYKYVLIWESKHMIAVSTAIQDWLKSKIAMTLMKQGAMMTVLRTMLTALAWPATLLSATDFIDSKWAVAIDRSDKAGILLAEVLLKGLQGNRYRTQEPVALIGYSLGARVIFKCLESLSKSDYEYNIVERVVLLGAPIKIKDENWEAVRKTVAGRFVNVFSRRDWILGVAFRASLVTKGLAGIQAIDVPGIENVDATDLIDGHSSYLWATQQILDQLDLDTYFPAYKSSSTQK